MANNLPRHVTYHRPTTTYRVRIQGGEHRGSYGYYSSVEDAALVAALAAEGRLSPGTSPTTRYPTEPAPLHGPRRPPPPPTDTATSRSSTGVRGVSYHRQTGRYHVRIRIDGRYRSFGLYDTLDDATTVARRAYNGEL